MYIRTRFRTLYTSYVCVNVSKIFNRRFDWPHAISPGNPARARAKTQSFGALIRLEAFIRDARIFLSGHARTRRRIPFPEQFDDNI